MATTITLTLNDNLTPNEQYELKGILHDAFAEFSSHRGPSPEEYVEKRYPNNEHYRWLDRNKKIEQVRRRCETALKLHSASFRTTFTITESVEESDPNA